MDNMTLVASIKEMDVQIKNNLLNILLLLKMAQGPDQKVDPPSRHILKSLNRVGLWWIKLLLSESCFTSLSLAGSPGNLVTVDEGNWFHIWQGSASGEWQVDTGQ